MEPAKAGSYSKFFKKRNIIVACLLIVAQDILGIQRGCLLTQEGRFCCFAHNSEKALFPQRLNAEFGILRSYALRDCAHQPKQDHDTPNVSVVVVSCDKL